MLYSIDNMSHSCFCIGWFATIMKTALLILLATFVNHLLLLTSVVDAADTNENNVNNVNGPNDNNLNNNRINPASLSQHHDPVKEDTSNPWFAPKVTEDAVNHEAADLGKSSEGSYCDIFYMLVSTIDGRVSALDLHDKGTLVWSVQADARPLYSSSLTNMEVTHKGKKIRLIPSLDGALYQFDGDKLEALPLSAEALLSTTYKLSDDSMIVGSQDARNLGIDLHTGEILFTCGSEGCSNSHEGSEDKLLEGSNFVILTRTTQVVRSVDIKHGYEKWNFSIGQHQVKLLSAVQPSEVDNNVDEDFRMPVFTTVSGECPSNATDYEKLFQVLLPEGQIVAFTKRGSSQLSWEHKFDCPIANAWLLRNGKLEAMSLSDEYNVPSLSTYIPEESDNDIVHQPLLYIGSHQRLLYIQASPQFESTLERFTSYRIGHLFDPNVKVTWKPYLNTASVRTPIFRGNRPHKVRSHKTSDIKSRKESTSLTLWNEDYPFDTGYFLYPEFRDIRSRQQKSVMLIEDFASVAGAEKHSLWQYCKDVMFVSLAILTVHVILTRIFGRNKHSTSLDIYKSDVSTNIDGNLQVMTTSDSSSVLDDKLPSSGEYVSRFATDFNCLHCLGKGGFGVVFEAVNKVDDQHYAVKRITLPKSEGAKEKVLREVKALATLEHQGIVRYFNAWVESPPAGWQEERDRYFCVSDASKPSTTSNIRQLLQDESPFVSSTASGHKDRNRMRVHDKHLGARVGSKEITDSVLFSSETTPSIHLIRECNSETFSVHSDYTDISNKSETDFNGSDDNVFLCGNITNVDTMDYTDGSKSDISNSNYSFKRCALFSYFSDQSRQDELSDGGFRPERASNTLFCDYHLSQETNSSTSDSVAFEKSVTNGENHKEEGIQYHCQKDLQQEKIDFPVSSNVNDSEGEKMDNKASAQRVACETRFFLYIQMQLYRKETLKDWLSNNTLNRDRYTVLNIFDQIACAVDYVHTQGLMHRDLKPSNIFFTVDEAVKIGDFGLVTALSVEQDQELDTDQKFPDKHTAEVGTTLYMSPEQIAKRPYDFKIDIFSLGLILLELLVPFFTEMERIKTLQDARKKMLPLRFIKELPQESELVHKMTDSDPDLRPIAKEILDHPLFLEYSSARIGTRHRRRTVSSNSIS